MLKFPVFVLEAETGDMDTIDSMKWLLIHVEEFWIDIKDDFRYWDCNGHPLKFEKSFLDNKGKGYTVLGKNELEILKAYVFNFAEKNGFPMTEELKNTSLNDIVLMVKQKID